MGARPWIIGVLAGAVLIGLGVAAYQMGINEGEDRARSERPGATAAPATAPKPASGPGRRIFASTCGSCHTLAAAQTSGTVGPNLDDLKPDSARVLAAIHNGGTGSGQMPAGLLRGQEAAQVAAFVSDSAGR